MEDSLKATAFLLAPDATRRKTIVGEVTFGLESRTIKLSDVIISMQDPLFSDDAAQRAMTMSYLSSILEILNREALSRADVSLLSRFMQARYELDPSGFKENSQALRYLSSMKRFEQKTASEVVSKVFNAAQPTFAKAPVQARFEVYKLLDELLNRHRSVIRNMGTDFITIIVDISSSERDPRNLMLIFSMVEVILAEWDPADTAEQAEDLYDLLSRYFPISFRPKEGDPIGISSDDLILRLRKCFAAYSGFALSLFPELISRLDDTNRLNAKADVLLTMEACIRRYEPGIIAQWSIRLWDALKYEIFNSSDDSQAPNALKVIGAIAFRLSIGCTIQTLNNTSLQSYVDLVVKECMERIRENGLKYGKSAGQIMAAVETGSPFSYHLVIRACIPALTSEFDRLDANIAEKRTVIEIINQLLDAKAEILRIQSKWEFPAVSIIDGLSYHADMAAADGEDAGIASGGLSFHRDRLTSIFMGVARDTESEKLYRVAAIQGLSKLLKFDQFLERQDVDLYIQYLSTCVLETPDLDNPVRMEAIRALQDSATTYTACIIDSTFPILLGGLPDVLIDDEKKSEYLAVLAALGDVASRGSLMETLLRRFISKLDVVIHSNPTQAYGHIILAGILYAVEQREAQTDLAELKERDAGPYRSLVEELLHRVAALNAHGKSWYVGLRDLNTAAGKVQPDDKFLELVGKVIMTTIRSVSFEDQEWFYNRVFSLNVAYDSATVASIAVGSDAPRDLPSFVDSISDNRREDDMTAVDIMLRSDIHESQFDLEGAPADQTRALILTKYILAGLRRNWNIMLDVRKAARCLIDFLIDFDGSPVVRSSLLDLLAILINKFATLKHIRNGDGDEAYILGLATNVSSKPPKTVKNIVQIICTITQAANLSGDVMTSKLIQLVLAGLETEGVAGQVFAQAFNSILAENPILIPKNFAIVRSLAKQRLFSACVPTIVHKFATCGDQKLKANYLVGLGGILKNVPGDMIMPHIDTLLPLLLQSIESGGDVAKAASIDVVRIASIESPNAVEAHDAGIIRRLLACIANSHGKPASCSADTRIKALECLQVLPASLRLQVVLPHKRGVVAALAEAVNDPSRRVRMAAVDCQAVWWRLASASEEED